MNFRTQITAGVFFLTLTAVAGSAAFFLWMFQHDKIASILESERSRMISVARHLENTVALARLLDPQKISDSREIIFVADGLCSDRSQVKVSDQYAKYFEQVESTPERWVEEVRKSGFCTRGGEPGAARLELLSDGPTLAVPYILAAMQFEKGGSRLAMIAMDGFATGAADTVFLVDVAGKSIWSADGWHYVDGALADTEISSDQVKRWAQESQNRVFEFGSYAIVATARVMPTWTLISLAYRPAILKPVEYAFFQTLLLLGGVLCLCLIFGKVVSGYLTRPLLELTQSADRISTGDFITKFKIKKKNEIGLVQNAFNRMMDRIRELINETKQTAVLENELELAKKVQQMFIPAEDGKVGPYLLSSYFETATHCGGDWWGYIKVPPDRLVVMVGDVEGHGAASALITASIRGAVAVLEDWILQNPDLATDPRQINRYLNHAVHDCTKGQVSMTFFTVVLDPQSHTLTCCNAGHNLPYLLTHNALTHEVTIKPIGSSGIQLGFSRDTVYEDIVIEQYEPGSLLFLFSDGLVEAKGPGGLEYGRRDFKRALREYQGQAPKAFLTQLLNQRSERLANAPIPDDDVTAIACQLGDRMEGIGAGIGVGEASR